MNNVYASPDMKKMELLGQLAAGTNAIITNAPIINAMADLTLLEPRQFAAAWRQARDKPRNLEDRVYAVQGLHIKPDIVQGGTPDHDGLLAEWLDAKNKETKAYITYTDSVVEFNQIMKIAMDHGMTEEAYTVWAMRYVEGKSMGNVAKSMNEDPISSWKWPKMTKSRVQYLLNLDTIRGAWRMGYTLYLMDLKVIDNNFGRLYPENIHNFTEYVKDMQAEYDALRA